jgi:hypothetical protein
MRVDLPPTLAANGTVVSTRIAFLSAGLMLYTIAA